jgi:pentatricopeptide repeat protein
LERASVIFKEIKTVGLIPSATCYNLMLDLCIQHNQLERVNNLLNEMSSVNIPPDTDTFVVFVKARDLDLVKKVLMPHATLHTSLSHCLFFLSGLFRSQLLCSSLK